MTRPALVSCPSNDRDFVPKRQNGLSLSLIKMQSHHAGFAHRGESSRNPACPTVRSDEGNCARRSKGFHYVPRAPEKACAIEITPVRSQRTTTTLIAGGRSACVAQEQLEDSPLLRGWPGSPRVRACEVIVIFGGAAVFAVSTSPLFGIWTETPF